MQVMRLEIKTDTELVPTEGERVKEVEEDEAAEISSDKHHWNVGNITEMKADVLVDNSVPSPLHRLEEQCGPFGQCMFFMIVISLF